jgi:hypothetical protein
MNFVQASEKRLLFFSKADVRERITERRVDLNIIIKDEGNHHLTPFIKIQFSTKGCLFVPEGGEKEEV